MQFSYEWLAELCPSGRSPEDVSAALTARGLTVDSVEARGADHVLEDLSATDEVLALLTA